MSKKQPKLITDEKEVELMTQNFMKDVSKIAQSKGIWYNIGISFLNGTMTAFGATAGFAILAFVVIQIYNATNSVPILNQVLKSTGIQQAVSAINNPIKK
jgi:hypothetical protein